MKKILRTLQHILKRMQKLRMKKRMNLLTKLERLCDFNFRDRVFRDRETLKINFQGFGGGGDFKNNDKKDEKTEELLKTELRILRM